ncbi:hypothetical protein N7486_006978 [Penicillium sp. IBT 16267x]|nr:hypothetical protein N7486_006978 [Penicillium sp. IBT 16267x]
MNFESHTDYEGHGPKISSSWHHIGANGINDDWTDIQDRKQRKKVQNRINQRAHSEYTAIPQVVCFWCLVHWVYSVIYALGRRINEESIQNPKSGRRPYQVVRWRIPNGDASQPKDTKGISTIESTSRSSIHQNLGRATPTLTRPGNHRQITDLSDISTKPDQSVSIQFPLPSDQLLHLIHYNVFRALVSNKTVLKYFTAAAPTSDIGNPHRGKRLCDGPTTIRPLHTGLPSSLFPTSLQMNRPHSSWIDMLPFPRMRDNLIQWEDSLDVMDFMRDIFGDLVNDNLSIIPDTYESCPNSAQLLLEGEDDDMVTAGRRGLIVWGEAHLKESWEATPGFLRKWVWLLEGCDELIEISNGWRVLRGEEPLILGN